MVVLVCDTVASEASHAVGILPALTTLHRVPLSAGLRAAMPTSRQQDGQWKCNQSGTRCHTPTNRLGRLLPSTTSLFMRPKKVASVVVPPTPSISTPVAFPLKDAATYSGLTVWALRNAIWDKKIVARLAGKRLLLLRADVDAFVASLPQVVSGPCNRSSQRTT